MIIKINSRSEMPIYLQLRNQIVKGIGKGELLTAEAKIRGMDKGQFIQFCQHIFEEMEMVPE